MIEARHISRHTEIINYELQIMEISSVVPVRREYHFPQLLLSHTVVGLLFQRPFAATSRHRRLSIVQEIPVAPLYEIATCVQSSPSPVIH